MSFNQKQFWTQINLMFGEQMIIMRVFILWLATIAIKITSKRNQISVSNCIVHFEINCRLQMGWSIIMYYFGRSVVDWHACMNESGKFVAFSFFEGMSTIDTQPRVTRTYIFHLSPQYCGFSSTLVTLWHSPHRHKLC